MCIRDSYRSDTLLFRLVQRWPSCLHFDVFSRIRNWDQLHRVPGRKDHFHSVLVLYVSSIRYHSRLKKSSRQILMCHVFSLLIAYSFLVVIQLGSDVVPIKCCIAFGKYVGLRLFHLYVSYNIIQYRSNNVSCGVCLLYTSRCV